jgi:hypothetical protein
LHMQTELLDVWRASLVSVDAWDSASPQESIIVTPVATVDETFSIARVNGCGATVIGQWSGQRSGTLCYPSACVNLARHGCGDPLHPVQGGMLLYVASKRDQCQGCEDVGATGMDGSDGI